MIPPILKEVRPDVREFFGLSSDTLWRGKDVVFVVGRNGAGKSVVRRMLYTGAKRHGKNGLMVYHFSQERRSEGGIVSAMTYGTEQWESTGAISVHTILKAFTSQPLEEPSIFIWDEPEIGLAEEAQLGLGQFVREQMDKGRENLLGCFFMTHSREFVHSFIDYPRMAFIDLDGQYEDAEEWTQRELHPVTPQELHDHGHKRFKLVSALLNKGKK